MSIGLLAVIAMLLAAALTMFWPLRDARSASSQVAGSTALELARDAKLGEIRDLELDFRLGKLTPDDYRILNATLRAEAVEIMRRIDASAAHRRSSPAARRRR